MTDYIYEGQLEVGKKDFEWKTEVDIYKKPSFIMIAKFSPEAVNFTVTVVRIQ